MGGGAKYSLSALPNHDRSVVCNRLQVGATRTSYAREADSMREAIGIDLYNQCTTGRVAKTLNAIKSDADHVPCVLIRWCWTLDEKMGQTYVHEECANTLAQRDYKQPQAVIYGITRNNSRSPDSKD